MVTNNGFWRIFILFLRLIALLFFFFFLVSLKIHNYTKFIIYKIDVNKYPVDYAGYKIAFIIFLLIRVNE